ncbi:probable polyketide synthase, similar to many. e.g. gp/M63676/SERERYAA_1 S.erythraea first ORF of eryA gene, involved in complex polyketide formation in erythromycin biosynthesis [Rhodococcus wratislaviensis]|uniref:Probable polyketide synthase, similar to many. e.g. gp/M63676/SERERYAA_1 S.erythraea first ORF of eryA gene, involved in complex polyketide formation in erythromycin biosynthesis n=2 Tax=Rhodococcus wratislaviensis TaxID=44752 RepID=A0A402C388_RHOWR|nr:probable polyketide synthase, similar to many. e.g. gp/M63676/SERERYAA_1 S.erythraea first ORF of eryA gene, involved in complex polyketide formation in erythromycin biosynthesis [Rhodococcus wratislaviensis]
MAEKDDDRVGASEATGNVVGASEATGNVTSSTGDMTVAQLRDWLRNWIADATGQPVGQITDDRPMEEFGLSSRDAVALSGEIEELVGVTLTATVAYQHPTIASLATRIIEGEPEQPDDSADAAYYASAPTSDAHDIAIVGLASRFPGAGKTPAEMWQMLAEGRDGISDLPAGRWEEFTSDPQIKAAVEKANTQGGYLDDVKTFDAEFFAMSPLEVANVDPQQRLAMELTWEALEHARIPASDLKGEQVGVFIGSSANDYQLLAVSDPVHAHPYALTGTSTSIVANRVSYFYDFRGPSIALDTACSSSLVAVHQAVRSLRSGESDLALAGGVNMLVAPPATLGFDQLGVMAPNGRIKAFSSDADGMIRAEGGGLVVLKRLEDAERDGDEIFAVIAGSAVNQDGRSNGLAAPNPDAQADVLRHAYRDAGINPAGVDYIEAHGTGTILGDPIEADALGRVVGRGRADDKPALLGSAKTNFGHLEAAAGAAGLIKVVLSMREDTLPPTLNFAGPNPYIAFDKAHLQVIPEGAAWPRYTGAAVAGVSGFGFGGTNAHVVVREYTGPAVDDTAEPADTVAPAEVAVAETEPTVVLAVSGALPSRRRRAAADLADWLETEEGSTTPLADVARALARRNHGRSRAVVLAKTTSEAVTGLRAVAAGKPGQGVFTADSPSSKGAVWVLSGFGSQHRKMAKQLYLENPVFAAAIDEVDALIEDEAGYSMKEKFLDDAIDYDVETSQVGIFTIQIGLAALLRHHGAEPEAVVGHSMGEAAAAYISGGLPIEDAVRVICARSRLMGEAEATLEGDDIRLMALVEYSASEIETVLTDFPHLEVCVYAAPTHTVIGGPEPEVNAIVARAEGEEKMARVLKTKGASHTSQVDPLLGELAAELAGIEPTKLKLGVYSSVDQDTYYRAGHEPIHREEYWTKGLRHSVYFTNAVRLAVGSGHTTFVELAPNPVALMSVAATAFDAGLHDMQLIQTLKRKEDEPLGVLAALAQLYVHGHAVDLSSLLPEGDFAAVPRTAWIRKPYWVETRIDGGGNTRVPGAHVSLPDGRHVWEVQAGAVTDLPALVTAAAAQVLSDVTLAASVLHAHAPAEGTLTTTLNPHPGGASLQVHAKTGANFTLLFDAAVTSGDALPEPVVAAPVQAASPVEELPEVVEDIGEKWDPNGSQTLEDRLALIVAESMGYAPEDLPAEIPLIELGLDSLMAVRIKNRVEYEFDIPQLQLQAVRDANLMEVGKYLRYAVENREEVQALADKQKAEKEAAEASEAGAPLDAEDTSVEAEAEAIIAATPVPDVPEAAPEETAVDSKEEFAEATGTDVPPRDAAERLTFATWAVVTGESAKGIFNTLPILNDDTAEKLAARLSERANGEITFDDVLDSTTIEELANVVRGFLEDSGKIDGLVRALRARPEGSDAVPVFVFHPAGGSTVAYEPLLKRLPEGTPMYGFERTEGPIDVRAAEYLPLIREIQGDGPYVLYGWSLGGVLAYAVAKLLRESGADVRIVGLIDTVMAGEKVEDTPDEIRKRWQRYAAFAKKTYNVDYPLPYDKLAAAESDEEQIKILTELLKLSGTKIPGGIIEHQRTSWLDNRAIQTAELEQYDGDVVLYMADRYHDDVMNLEPAFKTRKPDGGWGDAVKNLEIIHVGGDHIQIVDEPYIAKVGADLTKKLAAIQAAGTGAHQ